jgi:hypothetical protein
MGSGKARSNVRERDSFNTNEWETYDVEKEIGWRAEAVVINRWVICGGIGKTAGQRTVRTYIYTRCRVGGKHLEAQMRGLWNQDPGRDKTAYS